jgi:hypothetical protein
VSLTQSGTMTLTIDTSGNGHTAALAPPGFKRVPAYLACLLASLVLLRLRTRRPRVRKSIWLMISLCALGIGLSLTGCGGGGSSGTPTTGPVTPPGTYTIVVEAKSFNFPGSPVQTTVTLVVK